MPRSSFLRILESCRVSVRGGARLPSSERYRLAGGNLQRFVIAGTPKVYGSGIADDLFIGGNLDLRYRFLVVHDLYIRGKPYFVGNLGKLLADCLDKLPVVVVLRA